MTDANLFSKMLRGNACVTKVLLAMEKTAKFRV